MFNQENLKQNQSLWTRQFILIMITNLFVYFSFNLFVSTLPVFVVEKVGGKETDVGIVVGIFIIFALLIRSFAGRFADSYGRRVVYLVGLLVMLLCALSYNLVGSIAVLCMVRVAHGFGWGVTTTVSNTIAADAIPPTHISEGMGYFSITSNIAGAVGPIVGLAVVANGNFGNVFSLAAGCTVFAFVMVCILPMTKVERKPQISEGSLFERSALTSALIMGCLSLTYGTVASFIPIYAKQFGISNIGPFFTVFAVSLIIVRLFTGRIADKRSSSVIIVGIVFTIIAMVILSQAHSLGFFLWSAGLYGMGFGGVTPVLQATALSGVNFQRRGAASATFLTGMDMGTGLGSVISGVVAQAVGISHMYLLATVPLTAALVVYWLSRNTRTLPQKYQE